MFSSTVPQEKKNGISFTVWEVVRPTCVKGYPEKRDTVNTKAH